MLATPTQIRLVRPLFSSQTLLESNDAKYYEIARLLRFAPLLREPSDLRLFDSIAVTYVAAVGTGVAAVGTGVAAVGAEVVEVVAVGVEGSVAVVGATVTAVHKFVKK